MRAFLTIFFITTAQPTQAACHRFTRWHYPWAQRCVLTDKSWYVEIVKLPETWLRDEAVSKLKEVMK